MCLFLSSLAVFILKDMRNYWNFERDKDMGKVWLSLFISNILDSPWYIAKIQVFDEKILKTMYI